MNGIRSRFQLHAVVTCLLTALWLTPRLAWSFCTPIGEIEDPAGLVVVERLLVLADTAEPTVILQCGVINGAGVQGVQVGLTQLDLVVTTVEWNPTFNELWQQTAPQVIQWIPPSAIRSQDAIDRSELPRGIQGQVLVDAPVVESPFVIRTHDPLEPNGALDMPPMGEFTFRQPLSSADAQVWLPAIQIPLAHLEQDILTLPLLDSAPVVDPPADPPGDPDTVVSYQRDTTVLFLSNDRYLGANMMDISDAVSRGPWIETGLDPHPQPNGLTLVIPDVRLRANRRAFGDFDTFYQQRIAEAIHEKAEPLGILEYMGSLGVTTRTGRTLPSLEGAASSLDRVVRVRLVGRFEQALQLTEMTPVLFQSTWIHLPDAPTTDESPLDPEELSLSDDALVFSFGAEPPAELTPGMVMQVINVNSHRLGECDPGLASPTQVDLWLFVEPSGSTLAVFPLVDDRQTGQCLVQLFTDMPFTIATGPPVSIQFPLWYEVH